MDFDLSFSQLTKLIANQPRFLTKLHQVNSFFIFIKTRLHLSL
jgi:hypothetical protein